MSTSIIRTHRDKDEYVVWESIVEAPVFAGNYAGTEAYLRDLASQKHTVAEARERMERARDRGTSALWADGLDWDGNRSLIYEQRGVVKVEDMWELTRRLVHDEDVSDLLEPFEDAEATS